MRPPLNFSFLTFFRGICGIFAASVTPAILRPAVIFQKNFFYFREKLENPVNLI